MIISGKKLKRTRKQRGFSRRRLSKKLDIKEKTIKNWERNYNNPKLRQLEKVCNLLKINPNLIRKKARK